jgi:hypothetical protein
MRLIRLLITLVILGGVVFFGVTVPLGGKTLWEHIKAIAGSKESQELVEGVKQKAEKIGTRPDAAGGGDKLTEAERKLLRRLIREKLGEGTGPPAKKPAPPPPEKQ